MKQAMMRGIAATLACIGLACSVPLLAQDRLPDDLTSILPVPTDFDPPTTSWGDPDLRGTWPIDNVASLPMQRPASFGDRFYLTDEEYAQRQALADNADRLYEAEDQSDRLSYGHFLEADVSGRRTSMLISPADGQLPALTPQAQQLYEAGRSSWSPGITFDWMSDFDPFDRCITRGMPASMFPHRYNNGIRVMQAPGEVIIMVEMVHEARIIPIVERSAIASHRWPDAVRTWMGQSLGYWDGNTLVIETTNIIPGDSVSDDMYARAASPLMLSTHGAGPNNVIPVGDAAKVVERLTMTGPDRIAYEVDYTDAQVFTAPWTARLDWTRNDEYQMFEYACHEGNVQLRNYITASRADPQALIRAAESEQ